MAFAITDSSQLDRLKKAEADLETNRESSLLLQEYNKKAKQLQKMQRAPLSDPHIIEEMNKEVLALKDKMEHDERIIEFFRAQKDFSSLMKEINDVIGYFVTGELNENGGCTSGGCSNCSGCVK